MFRLDVSGEVVYCSGGIRWRTSAATADRHDRPRNLWSGLGRESVRVRVVFDERDKARTIGSGCQTPSLAATATKPACE